MCPWWRPPPSLPWWKKQEHSRATSINAPGEKQRKHRKDILGMKTVKTHASSLDIWRGTTVVYSNFLLNSRKNKIHVVSCIMMNKSKGTNSGMHDTNNRPQTLCQPLNCLSEEESFKINVEGTFWTPQNLPSRPEEPPDQQVCFWWVPGQKPAANRTTRTPTNHCHRRRNVTPLSS